MPEKEYIEREDLLENIHKFAPEHNTPLIQLLIIKQPTADVAEVIHGKWVWKDFNGDGYQTLCCSECLGTEGARFTAQYCVECGAKMDGVSNEKK